MASRGKVDDGDKGKKSANNNNKKKRSGGGEIKKNKKEEEKKSPKKTNTKNINTKKNKMENPKASSSSSSSPVQGNSISASCVFPMSRVRRLTRCEGGNTAAADTRTTVDAVFLINKASEMFLKHLAKDAYANAMQEHKKSISYNHLSSTVSSGKQYEFLSDFVPEKIRAEDALKARTVVES